VRVIVFKFLAPVFKPSLSFRNKNEIYTIPDAKNGFKVSLKKKPNKKQSLISKIDNLIEKSNFKNSDLNLADEEQLNEFENYGRNLLHNLKLLNRSLTTSRSYSIEHSRRDSQSKEVLPFIQNHTNNMYIEEWKHVALVLDR